MITPLLLLSFAMLLAIVACAYFALSQDNHWRSVAGSPLSATKKRRLKWYSRLTWLASFVCFMVANGVGFAVLLWPLSTGLGIACITLILTYRPKMLRGLI